MREQVSYIIINIKDINYAYVDVMTTGTKMQQVCQSRFMRRTSRAPVSNSLIITMKENVWWGQKQPQAWTVSTIAYNSCPFHFVRVTSGIETAYCPIIHSFSVVQKRN